MRRFITNTLLAAFMAVSSGPGLAATTAPPLPLENLFGGPFELIDQDSRSVSDRDFRGRFMLIYFGYTFCPDICPYSLQTMSEALDIAGEDAGKIQPIFITTDPARDTAEFLKEYVAQFSPDLIGLTGSEEQVRMAAKAYRIHRRKVTPAEQESEDDYLVSHSSLVYLMGPDGKFLTFFPYDTDPDTMASAISKYVRKTETAAE